MPLISHIDLRVRDGEAALRFYDALLGALGFTRVTLPRFDPGEPVWRRSHWQANDEFFGFVADPRIHAKSKPYCLSRFITRRR